MVEDMLVEMGATVVGTASTIARGLLLATTIRELDAAVLDVNVREERIDPVATALIGRGVPIVFATGYGAAPEIAQTRGGRHRQAVYAREACRSPPVGPVLRAAIADGTTWRRQCCWWDFLTRRNPMANSPKTLDVLFHDTLKDIYFAEKKILATLPKMQKAAQSAELKAAFAKHHDETEGHVERLEEVFG